MIQAKEIVLVPLEEIRLNPSNYNKHSQEQIDRLAKIISYQGFREPGVISNRSGYLAAGEGRYLALKQMNATHMPCTKQDFEDDDQERAFGISTNAISAWAELDLSTINTDLALFDGATFDVDLLGIKDFEIEPADKYGDKDADDVPDSRSTDIKRGDLFLLGNHRLMCGDSTVCQDVELLMNGEKASIWLSDPPYGINHVEVSQEKGQSKGYSKIENDDLTDDEFKEFIFKSISASLPHMKEGFAFYMWHAMKMQGYTAAAAAAGILFHRQIIWVKPQLVFGRGHYHWRHELCLMGWLQGNEPPFYGERNQTTVWEYQRENDKIHPTQKPIAVLEPSILNHTKQNEIIYEPFSGSGSTIIACEKNNRRCFAMEISPEYVQVCIDRFEKFTGQKAVKLEGPIANATSP